MLPPDCKHDSPPQIRGIRVSFGPLVRHVRRFHYRPLAMRTQKGRGGGLNVRFRGRDLCIHVYGTLAEPFGSAIHFSGGALTAKAGAPASASADSFACNVGSCSFRRVRWLYL